MSIMNKMLQSETTEVLKSSVLSKFPHLGVTMSGLRIETTDSIPTACTDGSTVYYSPKFFERLTYDQQVFVMAHEILHVAFDHIWRSKDKEPQLWNIATDAVINQILQDEDLPIIAGCVDMPEAKGKSAEEMYDKLLKDKEKNQQNGQGQQDNQQNGQDQQNNQQGGQGSQQGGQGQQSNQQQGGQDQQGSDHSIWAEAVRRMMSERQQQSQNRDKNKDKQNGQGQNKNGVGQDEDKNNTDKDKDQNGDADKGQDQDDVNKDQEQNGTAGENKEDQGKNDEFEGKEQKSDKKSADKDKTDDMSEKEKNFSKENKQEKRRQGEKIIKEMESSGTAAGSTAGDKLQKLGKVGEAKEVLSWKKILKREFEKQEDRWSYRRASEENYYQARVESVDTPEHPITEVMLDTSCSVSDDLLRNFLRQLKPLLKESKLMVGCFDHKFYGFKEIKTNHDIDNFTIIGRGGTNFDGAIKHFSKDRTVNKIVFTDGEDSQTTYDPKYKNIMWLVYTNANFEPNCGKVIRVNKKEFYKNFVDNNTNDM